ncbi:MAG: hypothetical protein ACT4O2_14745 [Beijerinckiaceae bacterium]
MGTWGTGLYANDFAADFKAVISAAIRLPFDEDRLVEILCSTEPSVAENPIDEDHTVFWLVLADQFEKRGIASARARDTAVAIIDGGIDATTMARLGMEPADLRKRAKVLAELRARIVAAPAVSKPRATMKQPEPYELEIGGVYSFPTHKGENINPYMTKKFFDRGAWTPDGFGLMVLVERGRAFDYLAWYRPIVIEDAVPSIPSLASLVNDFRWYLVDPGTCSAHHFMKMELKKIAILEIDPVKLNRTFHGREPGTIWAINDISIANQMDLRRSVRIAGHPLIQSHQSPSRWAVLEEIASITA